MNNDLISREALKKDIDNLHLFKKWVREEIKAHIDNAPTVEAKFKDDIFEAFSLITDQEFEHSDSFWIETPKGKKIEFEKKRPQGTWGKWVISEIQCPNCFEYFQTDCYSTEELNKCPNCGADMRGGGEV